MKLYLLEGEVDGRMERVYVVASDLQTAINAVNFEPTRSNTEAGDGDGRMRARLIVVPTAE